MMERHEIKLSVAGITIGLETDLCQSMTPQFSPFLTEKRGLDCRVVFHRAEELPSVPEEVVFEDHCYRLHRSEDGCLVRSFFYAPRDDSPYGVSISDGREVRVSYLDKGTSMIRDLHSAFFHIGIESLLIRRNRMFFHAACVDTPVGGILFSGPSGIGKSTQAELWCRYRGGELINGDRPILSFEEGWRAWGAPYAGSSCCYRNESCPVAAIVLLGQAKENTLRRMSPAEAFRGVWSGMTVQSWDAFFVERVSQLVLELIGSVPVYELKCTPDESAVECLEEALRKELGL